MVERKTQINNNNITIIIMNITQMQQDKIRYVKDIDIFYK